jgi:hypothetical protein
VHVLLCQKKAYHTDRQLPSLPLSAGEDNDDDVEEEEEKEEEDAGL